METVYWTSFSTPWGTTLVAQSEKGIVRTTLPGTETDSTLKSLSKTFQLKRKETPLLKRAKKEVKDYLSGKRESFDLPLELYGTPFQKKVWNALLEIPYGKTASYQDVARAVGNVKAPRAVGLANNRNPIPLLIPCHRVIGKNGAMVGFGGGISLKKRLLMLECESSR